MTQVRPGNKGNKFTGMKEVLLPVVIIVVFLIKQNSEYKLHKSWFLAFLQYTNQPLGGVLPRGFLHLLLAD